MITNLRMELFEALHKNVQIVTRNSLTAEFVIPPGWTRISISDKTDPMFEFYIDTIFDDKNNFILYDQGLLAFIKVCQ